MNTRQRHSLIAWLAFAALAFVLGIGALMAQVVPLLGVVLLAVGFVFVGIGFSNTRSQPE